ncbi:secreted frizzled-related protein 3-like [Sycon ciliatum]|uniref:secreted frizzled-related protein 3-like n=1 Tax=Sycon ciliatum TaxID=27933 RepID=UPI0031F70AA6
MAVSCSLPCLMVCFLCVLACTRFVQGQTGENGCASPVLEQYRHRYTLNGRHHCKALVENRCAKYGYAHTTERNFLNHESQREASKQLHNFDQLIASNCSAELEFLLCTFHFPICLAQLNDPVQPCRAMCERVRDGCAPLLQRQGYSWPSALACDRLLDRSAVCDGRPEVCVNKVGPIASTPNSPNSQENGDVVPPTQITATYPSSPSKAKADTPRGAETSVEVVSPRPLLPPVLETTNISCEARCSGVRISKRQPSRTQWAIIGKVKSVSPLPSGKISYQIKIFKPLRVTTSDVQVLNQLNKGSIVRVTVKAKKSTGCACPQLKRRRRYILTGRIGDSHDLRMRQGDAAVLYQGRRHNLRKILPKWLRYWMGIH